MLVTLQKKCSKLWLIQQKERKDENSKQRLSSLQAAIQAHVLLIVTGPWSKINGDYFFVCLLLPFYM